MVTSTYRVLPGTTKFTYAFDLSGPANVTELDLKAIYEVSGGFDSVNLCSDAMLSLTGSDAFEVNVPSILSGKRVKLVLIFTALGNISKNKYLDNFRTNLPFSEIVLPVRFGAIDAKVLSNGVNLTWNVDAEENLRGYEVERSADGVRYASIGSVAAAGQRTYSYFDGAALASAFYRIRSVDVDGKVGYSTIVRVNANGASIVLKAFMSGMNALTVQHDAAIVGARISVSTADGRVVRTVQPQVGMQQTSIDLSGAGRGMYIVRYEKGNGEVTSIKLMKQ